MTRLIPDGFLSIRQSAAVLATAMYSGVADRPLVQKLKRAGYDAGDGAAIDDAIAELWKGYDESRIEGFLIGPRQPVPIKLPSGMSQGIPALRSSRGGDLTFARGHNRLTLTGWFGSDLSMVQVVFREMEINRLARVLLRRRRRKTTVIGQRKRGRPSLQSEVQSSIRHLVDLGKWTPTSSIKTLTARVNGLRKLAKPVSEDTVDRALHQLQRTTKDRRYERVLKKRRLMTPAECPP